MAARPPTIKLRVFGRGRKKILTNGRNYETVLKLIKASAQRELLEFERQLISHREDNSIEIECDEGILSDMPDVPSDVDPGTSGVEPGLWKRQPTFLTKADKEVIYRSLEKTLKQDGPNSLFGNTVVRKNLAMGLIGKYGGKLLFFDEDVTMEIPPGALEDETIVYCFWPITQEDNARYNRVEDDLTYYAPTIDCGPDGTSFMQYITLKFKHCITAEDRNKAGMLNVFTRDGTNPEWRKDSDGSFEIDGEWAVLKTKHFCEFTVATSTAMTRAAGDKSRWAVDVAEAMMLIVDTSLRKPLGTPVMQLISYLTISYPVMSIQPHDTRQLDFHVSLEVTKKLLLRYGPNELLGKVLKGSNYSVSVIGPKGGRLAFLDGSVIMDIPHGALKEPTVITCFRPRTETEKEQSNEGLVTYSPRIACGPDGTKFDKDVTLSVKHFIIANEPAKTNGLDMFTRNDSQPQWEKDAAGSFKIDGKWATLTTNHFSHFTIGVRGCGEDLPRRDVLVSTAITKHDDAEQNLDLSIFFASSNPNQMHQFIFDCLKLTEYEVFYLDKMGWNLLPRIRDQTLITSAIDGVYTVTPDELNIPANILRALPTLAHALQFQMKRKDGIEGLICDIDITQNNQLITTLHVDRTHHYHQQQAQQ